MGILLFDNFKIYIYIYIYIQQLNPLLLKGAPSLNSGFREQQPQQQPEEIKLLSSNIFIFFLFFCFHFLSFSFSFSELFFFFFFLNYFSFSFSELFFIFCTCRYCKLVRNSIQMPLFAPLVRKLNFMANISLVRKECSGSFCFCVGPRELGKEWNERKSEEQGRQTIEVSGNKSNCSESRYSREDLTTDYLY